MNTDIGSLNHINSNIKNFISSQSRITQDYKILSSDFGSCLSIFYLGFYTNPESFNASVDKVDKMLEISFVNAVKKSPEADTKKRQTLFFSTTMVPGIRKFADTINPMEISATPISPATETADQPVYFVEKNQKLIGLKVPLATRNQLFQ